jgi:hypothetical protein
MDETPNSQQDEARPRRGGESPFWTIIAALIFLYLGFFAPFVAWEDDPAIQKLAVQAFNWMARIVGIGLLVAAALAYGQIAFAHPLNFLLALIAAIGCLGAGAIWMANGYNTGFLILILGVLNGSAARSAWLTWRRQ